MEYEKILKREDGSRVKIEVSFFFLSSYGDNFRYGIDVYRCEKGKRTWINCCDKDSYTYRSLKMSERKEHEEQANLIHVTQWEIYQAKIELWKKFKPIN